MERSLARCWLRSAICLSVLSLAAPAFSQNDGTLAGRLSCTTEGTSNDATPPADVATATSISCTFQPTTGQPSKFTGAIGRTGGTLPDGEMTAKRVLVWLVHGPTTVDPGDLAGVYSRTSPQPAVRKGFEDALLSADGVISLIPPAGSDQLPGNTAITVLELTLSALRI